MKNRWVNFTMEDYKQVHILLQDWMYTKRFGSGDDPASEKQILFIEKLGGVAPLGITKKEASRIISDLQDT